MKYQDERKYDETLERITLIRHTPYLGERIKEMTEVPKKCGGVRNSEQS